MDDDLIVTYTTTFRGLRVFDRSLYPVKWKLRTELFADGAESDYAVNVVFTKLNYFFQEIVNDSVFHAVDNRWAAKSLRKTDNNIVLTPFDPSDSHLALLFQAKMNAIGNGHVRFGVVELESDNDFGLSFMFIGEANLYLPDMTDWIGDDPYFSSLPWWHRSDGSTMDARPRKPQEITGPPDFVHDLTFLTEDIPNDAPADVIRPDFKPKVIRGLLDDTRKQD